MTCTIKDMVEMYYMHFLHFSIFQNCDRISYFHIFTSSNSNTLPKCVILAFSISYFCYFNLKIAIVAS